jgi:hypothetical protein
MVVVGNMVVEEVVGEDEEEEVDRDGRRSLVRFVE